MQCVHFLMICMPHPNGLENIEAGVLRQACIEARHKMEHHMDYFCTVLHPHMDDKCILPSYVLHGDLSSACNNSFLDAEGRDDSRPV